MVERDFPSRREAEEGIKGAVRFRLHPLEQQIVRWLREANETEQIRRAGDTHTVHRKPRHEVYTRAESMGYKDQEIEAILDLMEERNLIEFDARRGFLREAITQAPSVDEFEAEVQSWAGDLEVLLSVFPQSRPLTSWRDEAAKLRKIIDTELRRRPDDERLIRMRRTVQARRRDLSAFAQDQHQSLHQQASRMLTSFPEADRRQGERLSRPVQGSVDYVGQVDDLRARLDRQYAELIGDIEQLKRAASATHTALGQDELSLDSLSTQATKLHELRDQVNIVQERRNDFREEFDQFAAWVELVEKGSALRQKMRQLGSAVAEKEPEFDALSHQIQEHISVNKLDALPDAATYELQLQEIAKDVREIEEQATDRFNHLQQRYQDALVQKMGYPRDRLWSPERYNPVAPEHSYRTLRERVSSALQQAIGRLEQVKRQQEEDIRSMYSSPVFRDLPSGERSTLESEIKNTEQALEALDETIGQIRSSVREDTVLSDFPVDGDGGAFREALTLLADTRDRIIDLQNTVDQVTDRLRSLKLSPEEAQLHEVLSDHDRVDLGSVQQSMSGLDDIGFWKALRGLYDKRRIRIYVDPIRRE